ncbi:hypothetical protein [Okeania sp. SIO1F9]|uniref:hypothetical protein n=1 Tax=Okeania sp. SIO1F9 TaxID=2607813 RepID=UPI00144F8B62|nr:hypothetical protein [Okeania sp. SIO1F9]NET74681.1 hypothetical protein [Okeania sp. SIO1F9]
MLWFKSDRSVWRLLMFYWTIVIIFFVGLIPHRQRGCSRITWGSESPCNFPPVSSIAVSCLLLQCSGSKAIALFGDY